MWQHRIASSILALPVLAACGSSSPASPSPVPISRLSSAPTQVAAAGATLTMTVSLWRDFMPISPTDGKPLVAVARIGATDGSRVPDSVRVDTLYVLHDGKVWEAAVEEQPRNQTAPAYEVIARNGPKWGPGITVDVVVRLVDARGEASLLRAPDQRIVATH